jgi:hypothetical protein
LASAGDVDGDGRSNILIGAVLADPRRDPNTGSGVATRTAPTVPPNTIIAAVTCAMSVILPPSSTKPPRMPLEEVVHEEKW